MRGVGIVTDASAQFLTSHFPGRERVHFLPWSIRWAGERYPADDAELARRLPPSLVRREGPTWAFPTEEAIAAWLQPLMRRYDALLLLPLGSGLGELFQRVNEAAAAFAAHYPVYAIDTHTLGAGLGWLVQESAALAAAGADVFTLLRHTRGMSSRIYTAVSPRALTYLCRGGFLEPDQAIVGEMLEMYPFFVLEEGRWVPLHKARSSRHLLDLMQEFASEFVSLEKMAVLHPPQYFQREARNLHERFRHSHEGVPVKVAEMNAVTAAMLGPRTLALFVLAA